MLFRDLSNDVGQGQGSNDKRVISAVLSCSYRNIPTLFDEVRVRLPVPQRRHQIQKILKFLIARVRQNGFLQIHYLLFHSLMHKQKRFHQASFCNNACLYQKCQFQFTNEANNQLQYSLVRKTLLLKK